MEYFSNFNINLKSFARPFEDVTTQRKRESERTKQNTLPFERNIKWQGAKNNKFL
tara:strand:- start:314 stop:478 length:165 start_codon:yes stop_codon:yes gene_type:complete